MRKKKDNLIISCPKCHTEYLIPEIFYQDDLIKVVGCKLTDTGVISSNIHDIIRDDEGKIKFYQQDEEPQYVEHWECDNCGCSFDVSLTFSGETIYTADIEKDPKDEWTIQEEEILTMDKPIRDIE